jgi:hypothetical protein
LGGAQGEAGSRQVIAAQEQEFFVLFSKTKAFLALQRRPR